MSTPKELLYSKSHEWVKFIDETTAIIGLTDFAQNALGDIVFIGLPEEGDNVTMEESMGDVESVKAVSDIFSPVSGVVSKINDNALDSPETVNANPYDTWLVEVNSITEKEDLLSAAEYDAFCLEEE